MRWTLLMLVGCGFGELPEGPGSDLECLLDGSCAYAKCSPDEPCTADCNDYSCGVDCNGAPSCAVTADAAPLVEVACQGAAECTVDCTLAEVCRVDCGDGPCEVACSTADCEVTGCGTDCAVTCGGDPLEPDAGTARCGP